MGKLGMGFNFHSVDRDQAMLLPVSMRDWLPDDHLVWFVLDAVERVDMTHFSKAYRRDGRGGRAHGPHTMVALLLYAYTQSVFSSRQIEKRCVEDVAFRVICGAQAPDHTTIARFRSRHETALREVFIASLVLCAHVGLATVGTVALDGTKIKAQASGHATVNEERLAQKAAEWGINTVALDAITEGVETQVDALLVQAQNADTTERDHDDHNPGVLRGRADREARFDQAKKLIAAKKQRDFDEYEAKLTARKEREAATGRAAGGRVKHPLERKNPPKYKANLSDPDSSPMKVVQGFVQGYNAQAWANTDQVILSVDVVTQGHDAYLLAPMLDRLHSDLAAAGITDTPRVLLADAGYCMEKDLALAARTYPAVDVFVSATTGREPSIASRGPIPRHASLVQRMRRKVGTKSGREQYRKRRWMIEPVFARIKHNAGFTRFSRRGLTAVTSEFQLLAAAQNIKTAFKQHLAKRSPATA